MPAEEALRHDPDDLRVGRGVFGRGQADGRQPIRVLGQVGRREDLLGRAVEQLGAAVEHPDVEVVLGVAQGEHDRWVRPQVADLLGAGLREDEERLAVPPEPDRDEVGCAVGPDRRQPDDRLLLEEPDDAGGGE